MKTSTMKTCMMTGKMCMCKSMDMCFVPKLRALNDRFNPFAPSL